MRPAAVAAPDTRGINDQYRFNRWKRYARFKVEDRGWTPGNLPWGLRHSQVLFGLQEAGGDHVGGRSHFGSFLLLPLLLIIATSIVGFIEGIIYLTKSDAEFEQIYVQGTRDWF